MGQAKRYMEEVETRGWSDVGTTICSECVIDPALEDAIKAHGGTDPCNYCEETPTPPAASAPLEVVLELVVDGLRHEYEDPVEQMAYDAGYVGTVYDTWDLDLVRVWRMLGEVPGQVANARTFDMDSDRIRVSRIVRLRNQLPKHLEEPTIGLLVCGKEAGQITGAVSGCPGHLHRRGRTGGGGRSNRRRTFDWTSGFTTSKQPHGSQCAIHPGRPRLCANTRQWGASHSRPERRPRHHAASSEGQPFRAALESSGDRPTAAHFTAATWLSRNRTAQRPTPPNRRRRPGPTYLAPPRQCGITAAACTGHPTRASAGECGGAGGETATEGILAFRCCCFLGGMKLAVAGATGFVALAELDMGG